MIIYITWLCTEQMVLDLSSCVQLSQCQWNASPCTTLPITVNPWGPVNVTVFLYQPELWHCLSVLTPSRDTHTRFPVEDTAKMPSKVEISNLVWLAMKNINETFYFISVKSKWNFLTSVHARELAYINVLKVDKIHFEEFSKSMVARFAFFFNWVTFKGVICPNFDLIFVWFPFFRRTQLK